MALNRADDDTIFLGIDGGGSKCRATLADSKGQFLGTGLAGPANPFQDTRQAMESIVESSELALKDAGLPTQNITDLIAGVGLAGVNLPRFYDNMNSWKHPFRAMFLTTDLHIACLGAHGGEDGAVMVAGTGSCGYYHVDGKSYICGAHGFPFGDKGSGAWIGLEAVKAVLLASDGLGPATSLESAIYAHMQTDSLGIIENLAGAASNQYAKFAPLVFAAAADNDTVARGILTEGAAYLGDIAEKLCASEPPRISFLGGLGQYIIPWLKPAVSARFSPALQEPDFGAIFFARQQWQAMHRDQPTQASPVQS